MSLCQTPIPARVWLTILSTQELDLSIPQAFVIQRPAGFVDPSLWEDGIPVAMLSWDLNGWHADMPDSSTDTASCRSALWGKPGAMATGREAT